MSKSFKGAVGLAGLACVVLAVIAVWNRRSTVVPGPSPPATADTTGTTGAQPLRPLDVTSFYDEDPSFDAPGCWQAVPRGLQTLGDIPFQIGGLIQLWGEGPASIGREYRKRVEGIPVGGTLGALYALHGSSFTTEEGTPIAEVVFRYTDGSSATNAIRYGTDTRDWWQPLAEHTLFPTNARSTTVWRGDHPSLPDWVKGLRLIGTAIENPKPKTPVQTVDLISTESRVTWVVLSLTAGPSGSLKADPKLEQDEAAPAEEIAIRVTALDELTGQPVPEARFEITLLAGRRPRPYGIYTADDQGHALIELPPEHIKLLSIQATHDGYAPQEMTWNVEQGARIPTNHVFKLTKE